MKKFPFMISLMIICTLLLNACGKSEKKKQIQAVVQQEKNIQPGRWDQQGHAIDLKLLKSIQLDTSSAGFLTRVVQLEYRKGYFYANDGINPEIIVFDSTGKYVSTVQASITDRRCPSCGFMGFVLTSEGNFVLKDVYSSTLFEVDQYGRIVSRFSPKTRGKRPIFLEMGSLVIFEESSERFIYSSIGQPSPQLMVRDKRPTKTDLDKFLRETALVGRFNQSGELLSSFARHHPIYAEYGLTKFQISYFVIYEETIYLIEGALPYVYAYSLEGKLQRRFGNFGRHHRTLKKQPEFLNIRDAQDYYAEHTAYGLVGVIEGIAGYDQPVLVVVYHNFHRDSYPAARDDDGIFLMAYNLEGDLLLNDIRLNEAALPGGIVGRYGKSHFLLLLDNTPGRLKIGVFSLQLKQAGF